MWYSDKTSIVIFLTHWGQVSHICVSKLTISGSDNGFSPGRRLAIIWTNAGIWLIGPLRTISSGILIVLYIFSCKKMHWKMLSGNVWPFLSRSQCVYHSSYIFLAATKQLYDWFSPSVCLSVCPSVRLSVTPFSPCSHHHIIMKFSGVITNDKSDVHAKGQGQRSKVKVTEVNTQLNLFRTVTLVWIHIWWWNDAWSLMMLRRGALLFLKVIRQISRSHGSKKRQIWPRLGVSGL